MTDLGGIQQRQRECGRKPIVGSERPLARRYSVAQVLSGWGQHMHLDVREVAADLTVDVRWDP